MAWWWASDDASNAEKAQPQPHSTPSSSTPSSQSSQQPPSPPPPEQQQSNTTALSQDDLALAELQRFLSSDPSLTSTNPLTTPQKHPQHPPPSSRDTFYPPSLSCRQSFDAAYMCSGLPGQLRNLYRYGGLRSCDELWAQWRFCMRTKAMDETERGWRIREWHLAKAARFKVGPSSEDVWEWRERPLEEGWGFVRRAFGEEERGDSEDGR